MATQWKLAIGIDCNKCVKAFVCSEHFCENDFKRKNKSELKKGSVPTIFKAIEQDNNDAREPNRPTQLNDKIERNGHNEVDDTRESIDHIEHNDSHQMDDFIGNVQCTSCNRKDVLIENYERQIEKLKKDLKSARNKAYYLESVKKKLSTILSQMKEDKLIDDKLLKSLEVADAIVFLLNSFELAIYVSNIISDD